MVVRPFGSLSKVYFYVHLRMERDFPKEIVVYFILVFSYSKISKLLGSNKSNYGSDYRAGTLTKHSVVQWKTFF